MTGWLLDTLGWTGVLLLAVLLARRPMAQLCGASAAYGLWALVLLRLVLPPLPVLTGAMAAGSAAGAANGPQQLLLVAWLGGALAFMGWRVIGYRRMRRELLAHARPVGEDGPVRLVESPAVAAPLAFGVRDKVVALPPGFMALPDRRARDFAIAHELAHHRGHDLLANIAAQAVLALHWFNPLAWLAWRAFRRDQEAACDARVLAGRAMSDRADYAKVIARFASGDRLPLAAPMACGVVCPGLGRAAIVDRLWILAKGDSPPLHRRTGLALVAMSVCALPFSATLIPVALPVEAAPRPPAMLAKATPVQDEPAVPAAPVARPALPQPVAAEADPAQVKTAAPAPAPEFAVADSAVALPAIAADPAEAPPQLIAASWRYAIALEPAGVVQSSEWLVVLSAPPRAPAMEQAPPGSAQPLPAIMPQNPVLNKKLAALASEV